MVGRLEDVPMTLAVCFKCGVSKFGAFVPCPACAARPQSEDDLALSLAMTDHYFDRPTLEQMGALLRDGKRPLLDPESHDQLVQQIRSSGMLEQIQGMFADKGASQESPQSEGPPPKES
jgi:hypothetical protein